jgi:HSP20 family molecular chaperone IbpA
MLMTRWDPFAELAALERQVDRIFGDVFGSPAEPTFFRLPVNVEEEEGKYLITAPLAGFKPEDVEVSYADGALTISAKHSEEKETNRNGYIRREVVSGNFYRQIPVGEVDPNSISAELENDVLKVSLPAPSQPQPVKIPVSSESRSKTLKEGSRKQLAVKSA